MEWDKELNKESYMLIRVDTNKTLADRINIVVNQAKYNYYFINNTNRTFQSNAISDKD